MTRQRSTFSGWAVWAAVVSVLALVIVVGALAIDWTPSARDEAREVVPTLGPTHVVTSCDLARMRLDSLRREESVPGYVIDDALINYQHYCQGGP